MSALAGMSKSQAAMRRLVDRTRGGGIEVRMGDRQIFKAENGRVTEVDGKKISENQEAEMGANVAAGRLRSFVERVERVEEEIAASQADRKEIYAEAKAEGYDVATLRRVVRERKKDMAARAEQLSLFDLYWTTLGEA